VKPARYLPLYLREPWPLAAGFALLAAILVWFDWNPFRSLDLRWTDEVIRRRFQMHLSPGPDERVFVVGLETADLMKTSSTSAEYDQYAEIVEILTRLEAKAIVFDLVLSRGTAEDSRRVTAAMKAHGNAVLGEAWERGERIRSFSFGTPQFFSGVINVSSDPDGIHRHYYYANMTPAGCRPSLALEAYFRYLDIEDSSASCASGEISWKELGPDQASVISRSVSLRPKRLNFRAPYIEPWNRGFRYLNLRDLREKNAAWNSGERPKGLPDRGDIVLVGSVATGVGDAGPTPFGNFEPLIELHATALSDLLQNHLLAEAPRPFNALLTFGSVILVALLSRFLGRTRTFFAAALALVPLILAANAALLIRWESVLVGATPVGFVLVALVAEAGRRAGFEAFERARTEETLGRYFSPNVLKDVLDRPATIEAREAELTVLLTDMRNFTSITERCGARRIFELLNDVFEVETRAVLDLDGSMEHFVGDQFLAYWGAPRAQPDAADRALEAAERIIAGLAELEQKLEPEIRELFGYGVAIHTGKAVFGNKGSARRLDYGILGDIVNGAARIESLTKVYGVREIVTPAVLERAARKPATRFLDRIRVKGKSDALEIHEVLRNPGPEALERARDYEQGWHRYAAGDFHAACEIFERLAPADGPSRLLLKRCGELLATPPAAWDGMYAFAEK
jgi:adenylate cyclase